jgi:glycosyltransferase involved in cell wall biosynthesis
MSAREPGIESGTTRGDGRLRVAHIVAYRDVAFPRNGSIVRALEQTPDITLLTAHNRSTDSRRYLETWRALSKLRREAKPDVYVFGFRSHEIFWAFLFGIRNKPIVFDALMSPYASLHEERKLGWRGRLLAPLVFLLERSILRRANLVLTDTPAHIAYYRQTFGLPEEKLCALPVSAPELEQSAPMTSAPDTAFSVLFFGSFLPLHGIGTIVQAAAMVADLPIRFDFVGGSEQQMQVACKAAGVTRYTHRSWVPFDELVSRDIPAAHLCLGGPFGNTLQARRVITTKTAQCLAAGRATIVGRIEADIGFIDKQNCLLVDQANPQALASAIRWAFENQDRLAALGENGRKLYDAKLSTRVVGERLVPLLQALVAKQQALS